MTIVSSQANLLIVDDDQKSLMALQELLKDLGTNLVLAESGEEALRHILKMDFAVILLDARMPGVDGFATAKLIRARERSRYTPIIFLTAAYEDLSSMFRGYEAGAVDYIVKPLIPDVLKSKISVFVELYNKNAVLSREIAERKRAEEYLRTSENNLHALAAHLQTLREEERIRIAREIHDELGQALTGLKMDLAWLAKRLPADKKPLAEKTNSMFALIDDTIQSVRRIAAGLRPEVLDQLGLMAACGWQARDYQLRTGIRCRISTPEEPIEIDPERSTAAFRIFQELLTNVSRHANATKVEVLLQVSEDTLILEVHDNGKGFARAEIDSPKSLGFLGMRERVLPFDGCIEFLDTVGSGTRVKVSIPLA